MGRREDLIAGLTDILVQLGAISAEIRVTDGRDLTFDGNLVGERIPLPVPPATKRDERRK